MTHLCHVPPPVRALTAAASPKRVVRWRCRTCGWIWKLNPIVLQWFLDVAP